MTEGHEMPAAPRWAGTAAAAAVVGFVTFVVGLAAEAGIIRAVGADRTTLEWLSDAVISTAVAGITYLWLHLRAARAREMRLARDKIEIDEQLRIAAQIQRDLLPAVPETTPGFRWAARMVPAGRIGGDFYDFVQPAAGTVVAILGDVSGKGIPAALILSSLKTLFRTFVRDSFDPALVAARISAALYEEHGGLPYATAIVALFEVSPARLTYVNTGHPAGCVLHEGPITLSSGGRPLGLLRDTTYEATDFAMSPGDVGVLVTDGITEALEDEEHSLAASLGSSRDTSRAGPSPAEICERLLRSAADGPGPISGWQDDRTVFAFAVARNAQA